MKRIMWICAAVLGLAGCAKVEEIASTAGPAQVSDSVSADPFAVEPAAGVSAPAGAQFSVYAGFADPAQTRSRLEPGESEAKLLWTRGDSFYCLFNYNEGSYNYTLFSTQDDGVTSASFSTYTTLSGTGFHCIYPNLPKFGVLPDGSFLYGLNLPVNQNAVAGGIEEGMNRAFAYADQLTKTLDDPLTLNNAISLLKFRLDGAIVSQVKEITFTATGAIAGDRSFLNVDGFLSESPSYYFTDDVKSSKVVLKGDFEAGKDYYIALWPRQTSGFKMEFSDGVGASTVKRSSKTLTFERSRIKDFGTISLGDEFVSGGAGVEAVRYMTATEGTKPVTVAVIPEGFTMDELPLFEQLARSGVDALFSTEPYKTYRNRFNVYFLKAASPQSGASVTDGNGTVTKSVSTLFSAAWGETTHGDMRADDSKVFAFVNEYCPDIVNGIHPISEVPIIMIINDTRYGGICWSYSNGQGFGMIPYTRGGGGLSWQYESIMAATDDPIPTPSSSEDLQNYYRFTTQEDLAELGQSNGDWRNILVHEFGGHCFGRLGDEYWSSEQLKYINGGIDGHTWPVPMALNVASDPAAAPWKETLLDRRDDLTALDPHYSRIGVYQGAMGYIYGRWRSEKISCMIDNRFYFSAWQRYLIAKRIFTLSGDAAGFTFESWLAKDITVDPVRDKDASLTPGMQEHRTYTPVGPLPPPVLVEN